MRYPLVEDLRPAYATDELYASVKSSSISQNLTGRSASRKVAHSCAA